jgi:hypothetical protein
MATRKKAAKEPANKPAAESKKQAATEAKKTGTHEAIQEFRDYAESVDGTGYATFKVGDDVSHLPESKLNTLVDAGLVKKSQPKQEQ